MLDTFLNYLPLFGSTSSAYDPNTTSISSNVFTPSPASVPSSAPPSPTVEPNGISNIFTEGMRMLFQGLSNVIMMGFASYVGGMLRVVGSGFRGIANGFDQGAEYAESSPQAAVATSLFSIAFLYSSYWIYRLYNIYRNPLSLVTGLQSSQPGTAISTATTGPTHTTVNVPHVINLHIHSPMTPGGTPGSPSIVVTSTPRITEQNGMTIEESRTPTTYAMLTDESSIPPLMFTPERSTTPVDFTSPATNCQIKDVLELASQPSSFSPHSPGEKRNRVGRREIQAMLETQEELKKGENDKCRP